MADLRVTEVFDSLQGEGHWTGTPMTFVRLAGCNAPELGLDCVEWCDTPGSWGRAGGEVLQVSTIVERARFPRLCVTGGEPLLQVEGLLALTDEAHRCGMRVHIETNGTLAPPARDEGRFDWVVVSPKRLKDSVLSSEYDGYVGEADAESVDSSVTCGNENTRSRRLVRAEGDSLGSQQYVKPAAYLIASEWEGRIDELKLVVDECMDQTTAERLAAGHPEAIVSVQPMWGGAGVDAVSAERAIGLVMEHPEWRLSLQVHKYLGIR